jgi:DDE superfamily endonuclease
MLGDAFLRIASEWRGSFSRTASFRRSVWLALGYLCGIGRSTTSRAILALGQGDRDWSAFYRVCSRSPWDVDGLFDAALKEALGWVPGDWVVSAVDDTRLKKTGKKITGAHWLRDPLSPAFRPNLIYALRFLQFSVLLPLHLTPERRARAIPIGFELAPCVKKPGRRASEEDRRAYKIEIKERNLSVTFVQSLARSRGRLDDLGAASRLHVVAVDGSFCNKNSLSDIPERTVVLARARKDAKLCFRAEPGTRKVYANAKFTPEAVLKDETIPFQRAGVFFGGAERELRYKRVEHVLWQGGTKTRPLTLLVLAPTAYKNSKDSRTLYRNPAFLLCTSTGLDAVRLVQAYLDRWQIEVNHQEEKDVLGVGQAQVWSAKAVPRQPALAVAAYSVLMLAALSAFGPGRSEAYPKLPKWRKYQRRPSIRDILALLRSEFADPSADLNQMLNAPPGFYNLVRTAAA